MKLNSLKLVRRRLAGNDSATLPVHPLAASRLRPQPSVAFAPSDASRSAERSSLANPAPPEGGVKCLPLLFVLAVIFLSATPAFAKTLTYEVKKGDTCESIAKSVYGDKNRVDLLHVHNDLEEQCWRKEKRGKKLEPGTVLTLPEPPPDARVTARTGDVKAKSPKADWETATPGKELFRAWRVNTLEEAKAEVTFEDSSKVQMRENTLIVIYGATKSAIKKTPSKATLRTGALRSNLDALAGKKTMEVETPSAVSELGRGSALVSVDEKSGATRIANHSGDPVTVRGKRKKRVRKKKVVIEPGMGSKIEPEKDPTPPKKLPATPEWATVQSKFVTLQDEPRTITVSWKPVENATSYYVEFSRDAASLNIVQSSVVKGAVTNLEVQKLPVGDYFVRVAAIDDEQFESKPTKAKKVSVVAVRSPSQISESKEVAIGTRFVAPRGITCKGNAEQMDRWTVRELGQVEYVCADEKGVESGRFSVTSTPPVATFAEPTINGTQYYVDLTFENGMVYDEVSFTSDAYELGEPFAVQTDTLRVPVDGLAETGTVTAQVAGQDLASATVTKEIKIVEPYWLSAGVSGRFVPAQIADQPIDLISGVGGDFAIFPTSMFGVELGGQFVAGHSADAAFSPGVDLHGGALMVFSESNLKPLLTGGVGAMLFFGGDAYAFSAVPTVSVGGGVAYFLDDNFGIRFEGSATLSSADQSPTILPGINIRTVWK